MTAKKTANLTDASGQRRTVLVTGGVRSNCSGPLGTSVDGKPAVFKTVCGALLRRPGWVRFPSIPATFHAYDSQDDSRKGGATSCTSSNLLVRRADVPSGSTRT
jgi:hypothetical protein